MNSISNCVRQYLPVLVSVSFILKRYPEAVALYLVGLVSVLLAASQHCPALLKEAESDALVFDEGNKDNV